MYRIFFILICCSCMQQGLMQSLSWDLVSSAPIVFGRQVELRCTVTGGTCCSSFNREWNKGSQQIISSGITSYPAKYTEKVDAANNQFSLIISNLDENDVDVVYTCSHLNDSPAKTLVQNDSYEYHPSGSCPVTIDNGELVGTLNVAMSAPYPSVSAQYGGKNVTLTTTVAAVTGRPKFYTINSYIKTTLTCGHDEKFTLSVLTGVTTTNVCNSVDFCKCDECSGKCFGYAAVGTAVVIIILIILFPTVWRKKKQYTVKTGNSVTLEVSVCTCLVTDVYWQRNINGFITTITSSTNTNKYKGCTYQEPSLTIIKATESDAGTYTCFATNRVGTGQSSPIMLTVRKNGDHEPLLPAGMNALSSDSTAELGRPKIDGEGQGLFTAKQKMLALISVVSVLLNLVAIPIGKRLCFCSDQFPSRKTVAKYLSSTSISYKFVDKEHAILMHQRELKI